MRGPVCMSLSLRWLVQLQGGNSAGDLQQKAFVTGCWGYQQGLSDGKEAAWPASHAWLGGQLRAHPRASCH